MVEQQRLGFLGWFFRAFAAALGTVVGLLCGVAILGAGAWIWQERMGGEVDLEMAAPVIGTDLDLAIETDSEFDFGYESPEADSLMTPDAVNRTPLHQNQSLLHRKQKTKGWWQIRNRRGGNAPYF